MLNRINISSQKQKFIVYILLAVVTFAVFWQVNQFDFVILDDGMYITENNHVQSGITLNSFRWAFSTEHTELWTPLIWISLMLDYQLFGLNAGGYHLTNLILHILSTLLLFWLFCRMTKEIWRSAFVAALFALHPLHVQSVAWVSERKDVLSAFFWMLTLCLYVYYTEKPAMKKYLLVLFSFVLALMSKPMVVTLPVIMMLLDYWPLKRFQSQKGNLVLWQLFEKAPFFILSAVFSIITIYFRYQWDKWNSPFVYDILLSSRLANSLVSFVTYLEKTFWPYDLAAFYPVSYDLPIWQVLGAALMIIFISTAVIVIAKRMPNIFVGWLWYSITILPVIGIVPSNLPVMADHHTYLPLIGIGIMLAWSIPFLFPKEKARKKILFPIGIVFLTILSLLTWKQCGYWENSIKLINHVLQIRNDKTLAHNNLYITLLEEGKTDKAMENKTIQLESDLANGYNIRGIAYGNLGYYQKAVEDFNEAIRLKHNYIGAYNNRGFAYAKIGKHQNAIEDYNEAIRLKPDYAKAYDNRAIVYLNQGNNISGCNDAQKACQLGNCSTIKDAMNKGLCR